MDINICPCPRISDVCLKWVLGTWIAEYLVIEIEWPHMTSNKIHNLDKFVFFNQRRSLFLMNNIKYNTYCMDHTVWSDRTVWSSELNQTLLKPWTLLKLKLCHPVANLVAMIPMLTANFSSKPESIVSFPANWNFFIDSPFLGSPFFGSCFFKLASARPSDSGTDFSKGSPDEKTLGHML